MPFVLNLSAGVDRLLQTMATDKSMSVKYRKIEKALALLESNPRHPGLRTHRYQSKTGPNGEQIWEAYVENQTSRAWRIWFWYGPGREVIAVLSIGPHPD